MSIHFLIMFMSHSLFVLKMANILYINFLNNRGIIYLLPCFDILVRYVLKSESCGLVVDNLAHDQKVVGSILVHCQTKVVLKPCQDRFLHPILVHYKKNMKIQAAKWDTPKKIFKKDMFSNIHSQTVVSVSIYIWLR